MFRNRFLDGQRFFEEADKGGGGDDKAVRNLQSLLDKKNGDAMAVAGQLLSENADLRQKNRDLKATQRPADAVVLSEADAKKWAAFNELGTPEDVKKQIADAESAATERDTLKAEKVINQAAQLSGYKPDVLADLAKSKNFRLTVEGEGEAAKVIAHWKEGDKDAQKPLSEYAEESLSVYLPALQSEAAPAVRQGVPLPKMAAPGGGKRQTLADQIRAEEAARKAPTQGADVPKVQTLEERMNMTH